jgi:hypothetical protein
MFIKSESGQALEWTVILLTLIVIGMVIVAHGVGVKFPVVDAASNCYDLLNAAGQVVETICH